MEQVNDLVKTSVGEIEKLLSARAVVGDALTVGEATVIPLLSIGFCFGAGGGSGKGEAKQKGEGMGGGTVGAGGVKPIAVIIVDKGGVRVEPIKGTLVSVMEKVGDVIPQMMPKWGRQKKEEDQ